MLCDNIRTIDKSQLQYHKKVSHFFDRNNIKFPKLCCQTLHLLCGRNDRTKLTSIKKCHFYFRKLHYWLQYNVVVISSKHFLISTYCMCICQVLFQQTCYPTNKKIISTTEFFFCFYAMTFVKIYMYRLLQKVIK